jgi:hypothetical protein
VIAFERIVEAERLRTAAWVVRLRPALGTLFLVNALFVERPLA